MWSMIFRSQLANNSAKNLFTSFFLLWLDAGGSPLCTTTSVPKREIKRSSVLFSSSIVCWTIGRCPLQV